MSCISLHLCAARSYCLSYTLLHSRSRLKMIFFFLLSKRLKGICCKPLSQASKTESHIVGKSPQISYLNSILIICKRCQKGTYKVTAWFMEIVIIFSHKIAAITSKQCIIVYDYRNWSVLVPSVFQVVTDKTMQVNINQHKATAVEVDLKCSWLKM